MQTFSDGCRIDEISSTQPTGDVFVDPLHLHGILQHETPCDNNIAGWLELACEILKVNTISSYTASLTGQTLAEESLACENTA